jgi:hypothetical protein
VCLAGKSIVNSAKRRSRNATTSSQKRAFVDLSHALDAGVEEVKLGHAEVDIVFGPKDVAPRRPPIVSRGRDPTCGRFCQLAAARGVFGGLQQRKHFCTSVLVRGRPCSRAAGSWLLERGPAYARALADGVTICAPLTVRDGAGQCGAALPRTCRLLYRDSHHFSVGVLQFFALRCFSH